MRLDHFQCHLMSVILIHANLQNSKCHSRTGIYPNLHYLEHTTAYKHGCHSLWSPAQHSTSTFSFTHTPHINTNSHNGSSKSNALFVSDLQALHSCHSILVLSLPCWYVFGFWICPHCSVC